jgi:lysozyme family protein
MSSTIEPEYSEVFAAAVGRVLANESGCASVGGEGKFGLRQCDYPGLDLMKLARDGAIAIYFRDFWKAGRYSQLPPSIAVKLFDLSVDIGAASATRCLQRALRACGAVVIEDGALGNGTVLAARRAPGCALLAALRSEAAGSYRTAAEKSAALDASGQARFLEGRLRRAYE